MKAYILIILLSFIYSKQCYQYTHGRLEGSYSNGLFTSPSCACPQGLIGLVDSDYPDEIKKCYCYEKAMINECKADKNCQFDNLIGCFNK